LGRDSGELLRFNRLEIEEAYSNSREIVSDKALIYSLRFPGLFAVIDEALFHGIRY
jgi:hypothetical protein